MCAHVGGVEILLVCWDPASWLGTWLTPRKTPLSHVLPYQIWSLYRSRLRNDLYCVEWDVKLLVYHTVLSFAASVNCNHLIVVTAYEPPDLWPLNSPDLNPAGCKIWGIIQQRVVWKKSAGCEFWCRVWLTCGLEWNRYVINQMPHDQWLRRLGAYIWAIETQSIRNLVSCNKLSVKSSIWAGAGFRVIFRVVFEAEASGGGSKAGGLPTLPFPSPPPFHSP